MEADSESEKFLNKKSITGHSITKEKDLVLHISNGHLNGHILNGNKINTDILLKNSNFDVKIINSKIPENQELSQGQMLSKSQHLALQNDIILTDQSCIVFHGNKGALSLTWFN